MSIEMRVRQLVATTLKLPIERVPPSAVSGDPAAWDSMGQVNVVMALEQTFDVCIEPEDFASLHSVKAIVEYLAAHGIA